MEIPGIAAPLRFTSASVEMKDGEIHIDRVRAHVGALSWKATTGTIRTPAGRIAFVSTFRSRSSRSWSG